VEVPIVFVSDFILNQTRSLFKFSTLSDILLQTIHQLRSFNLRSFRLPHI
jgi:hypothetical protein